MPAENYRWVVTDRRTVREILNEIATDDTPLIIVSRENPAKLAEILAMIPSSPNRCSILLLEPTNANSDLVLSMTRRWPVGLSLLVTPPESFGAMAISGSISIRQTTAQKTDFLWDWLIRLHQEGGIPTRRPSIDRLAFPRLGNTARRKLTPPFPAISSACRDEIHRLAGVKFPAGGPDVMALRAGLFQWHDALDESHECSQSIEGEGKHRAGDYWHAIMHRREPDYGNSKYWFRHVGRHPVFVELGARAAPLVTASAPEWHDRLLRNGWDPFAFVDFCEAAVQRKNSEQITLAESIQEIEMLLLLASTYADATA